MGNKFIILLKFHVSALFILLVLGCATYRTITPELSEVPRQGIAIKTPVLVAVFDGRATKQGSDQIVSSLQNNLRRIYGNSMDLVDYFAKTPENRVLVRIRLMALGANFASRIISTSYFANSIGTAQVNATNGWNSVVAIASTQQSIFGGSFTGEGWWIGTAWIEMDIQDKRGGKAISFTVPVAAEHKESNLWGYSSGDKAAERAWNVVSSQMMRVLDGIFIKVRDEE